MKNKNSLLLKIFANYKYKKKYFIKTKKYILYIYILIKI